MRRWGWMGALALALGLLAGARPAGAQTTITGGSDLLGSGQANQLGAWLGEGPLTIHRIFAKSPGMSSNHFHAAVDGQGRTFTVVEVTGSEGTKLIGGYNPQSWSTIGAYNLTPNDPQRTAFLFNLTQGFKQDQKKTTDATGSGVGQYQTYNQINYGPTFGDGLDIYVDPTLNAGYSNPTSYGTNNPIGNSGNNIYGTVGYTGYNSGGFNGSNGLTVGRIEVFTIAPGEATPAVPEPSSALLFLPALGVMAFIKRRRAG